MRRSGVLGCGWALLCCLLSACEESTWPSEYAELVFEGTLAATPELLVLDRRLDEIRRLLPDGSVVMDPEPSPDGSQIAFVIADYIDSVGDIFVVRLDGTDPVQITFDGELDDQPSWSPDGSRIAFRSFRSLGLGDIWLMDPDGGNAINLTPDPLPAVTDEQRPVWSPQGDRIAYSSNAGGNYDIWTMAPDGTDAQRMTSTDDYDTEPAWSPTGTRIAFRRSNDTVGSDIYLISASGGAATPLARAGEQRMPVWTPDGGRIVFVHQSTTTARADLHSMLPNGQGVETLVSSEVPGGSLNPAYLKR
jgi:Tol biopolymer transport system component